jgi:hypothetical protein
MMLPPATRVYLACGFTDMRKRMKSTLDPQWPRGRRKRRGVSTVVFG